MRMTMCDICGAFCDGHGKVTVDRRIPLNSKNIPETVHTVLAGVDICHECADAIQKVINERSGMNDTGNSTESS